MANLPKFVNLKKDSLSTLFLVRHGEAEMNARNVLCGQLEPNPLTEKGKRQAKELAEKLCGIHIDVIFSSDLKRAEQTAEIIATQYKGEKEVIIYSTPELRERNWGRLQGKATQELREELKDLQVVFDRLPDDEKRKFKFVEDMESDEEIMSRFTSFLKKIVHANRGKTLLIVCHSNLMRTFLVEIGYAKYGELPSGSISNAGYIKLVSDGDKFEIEEIADVKKQNSDSMKDHIGN